MNKIDRILIQLNPVHVFSNIFIRFIVSFIFYFSLVYYMYVAGYKNLDFLTYFIFFLLFFSIGELWLFRLERKLNYKNIPLDNIRNHAKLCTFYEEQKYAMLQRSPHYKIVKEEFVLHNEELKENKINLHIQRNRLEKDAKFESLFNKKIVGKLWKYEFFINKQFEPNFIFREYFICVTGEEIPYPTL